MPSTFNLLEEAMEWSFKKVPIIASKGFCVPFEAYLVLVLTCPSKFVSLPILWE
jgi:hypothetical protein